MHALTAARRRSQEGFALIAVILVTLVTSTIVIALLGLSFTSSVYSTGQRDRDRLHRAANSAIDVAIDVLGRQGAEVGRTLNVANPVRTPGPLDPTDVCNLVGASPDAAANAQLPKVDIDGVPVVLTCATQAASRPDVLLDPPVGVATGDIPAQTFEVVGTNCTVSCGGGPAINWSSAFSAAQTPLLGASTITNAQQYQAASTLVHAGAGSLRFSSKVNVVKSAAAWRNDGFSTALASTIGFEQGDPGVDAPEVPNVSGARPPCGAQSQLHRPSSPALVIRTFEQRSVVCSSTPVKTPLAELRGAYPWNATNVAAKNVPVSALPACGSVPVTLPVVFGPGAYGPAAVARLNQMFDGSTIPSCRNRVFLFTHGYYYFDADAANGGPTTGALTFNDSTSLWVFGDPPNSGATSWNQFSPGGPGSSRPAVEIVRPFFADGRPQQQGSAQTAPCGVDESVAGAPGQGRQFTGVEMTLSTATAIRHLAGQVAICDRRGGGANPNSSADDGDVHAPMPAIIQKGTRLSPTLKAAWADAYPKVATFSRFSSGAASALKIGDGQTANVQAPCNSPYRSLLVPLISSRWARQCLAIAPRDGQGNQVGFSVNFSSSDWSAPVPTTPSPIDQLLLKQVYSRSFLELDSSVERITITGPNVDEGSCVVDLPTFPKSYTAAQPSTELDLLDPALGGNCWDRIDSLSDLSGGRMEMTFDSTGISSPPLNTPTVFDLNGNGTQGGGRYSDYVSCSTSWNSSCDPGYPTFSLDGISISAGQDINAGPLVSRFKFTSNVDRDLGSVASFNVYGQTSLPAADVDVAWNGVPTSEPMFGGTTLVNTLSSSGAVATLPVVGAFKAQPGLVCCDRATPSERVVVLNAWVNVSQRQVPVLDASGNPVLDPGTGRPRTTPALTGQLAATARVAMEDFFAATTTSGERVFQPGNDVRVLRYQSCALARLPLSFATVRKDLDPTLAAARPDGADGRCKGP